jgi:hypothetical protein
VPQRSSRFRRSFEVLGTARRTKLLRVLREIRLAGQRPATPEGARAFRRALEELGLLLASAWMARVNDRIAVVGFTVASILGLYMLWKILRTPGSL